MLSLKLYPILGAPSSLKPPLHGHRQRYILVDDWPLPRLEKSNEVLIRIKAIGLNPIDWKSVDYGFAIPSFPAVNGRDLAGEVGRMLKG
jgi:NADPH:quinone reductase-like Zn-dependent oxidoreductase